MKTWSMLLGLVVAVALVVGLNADEKKDGKEVTLKGSITCAKCDLKIEGVKACATVIKVKDGDKDVVYFFDADSHKKNHKTICSEGKPGSVKAVVLADKDGKKQIKVSEVKFD